MAGTENGFGAASTTDEVLAGVDLSGKTALVTGASAGLGVETVRALASHGATVVAAVRDTAKANKALAEAGVAPGDRVRVAEVDLASLASVRTFTDHFASSCDRLHLLIANAGVMACPHGLTVDGFETQFGTNHLGHFVLVNRLVPLLLAGAPSRVVFLSSSGHRGGNVDLADPNFETTPYNPWVAYGRSKTANVLFAVELDRRLRDRGVRACAVHPGRIETELFRHLDEQAAAFVAAATKDGPPAKSLAAGAATTVWAAVVAGADEVGGRYAEDCTVAQMVDGTLASARMGGVMPYALDPEGAAALWTRSEELVGEDFASPST